MLIQLSRAPHRNSRRLRPLSQKSAEVPGHAPPPQAIGGLPIIPAHEMRDHRRRRAAELAGGTAEGYELRRAVPRRGRALPVLDDVWEWAQRWAFSASAGSAGSSLRGAIARSTQAQRPLIVSSTPDDELDQLEKIVLKVSTGASGGPDGNADQASSSHPSRRRA
jgi:hypothetical protein